MKLEDVAIFEMAAKKTCEHCGKTMAANHYWYKGGWKCKKSSSATPAADVPTKQQDHKDDKDDNREYVPKDANEKAANDRALKFRQDLEREIANRK